MQLNRRHLLGLGAGALAASAVAGCSSTTSSTAASGASVISEDERTKAKTHAGRQPPQRQLPALLHRCTSAAQGAARDWEDLTLVVAPALNFQFSARALDFDSLSQFVRGVGSLLSSVRVVDPYPPIVGAFVLAGSWFIIPRASTASTDHAPAPTMSRKIKPSSIEKSVRASCIMLRNP